MKRIQRIEKFGALNEADKKKLRKARFQALEGKDKDKALLSVKKKKKESKINVKGNLIIIDNNLKNKTSFTRKNPNFRRRRRLTLKSQNGNTQKNKVKVGFNSKNQRISRLKRKRMILKRRRVYTNKFSNKYYINF